MADPSETSSTRAFNLVELDVTRNKVSPKTEKVEKLLNNLSIILQNGCQTISTKTTKVRN